MNSTRPFRTLLLTLFRTVLAVALFASSAALVCIGAKTSSVASLGKSTAKRGEDKARAPVFRNHLQTLLGRDDGAEGSRIDGAAQEAYDNRAYPRIWIDPAQPQAAASAAAALRTMASMSDTA